MKKKKRKRWNLWRDGVSQSLLLVFLQCKEQFRLKFKELWTSRTLSLPMEFGSCGHWLLRKSYASRTIPSKKVLDHALDGYDRLWKKYNPMVRQKEIENQEYIYALWSALFPAYCERWKADFGKKSRYKLTTVCPANWIALEEQFDIPYTYPDGMTTRIRGIWDGLFKDTRKGIWTFETKTKGVIETSLLEDILPVDLQVWLYLWAAWKKYQCYPKGILYNIIRRPTHRQGKKENYKQFLERLEKDINKSGRQDHFFLRWEMAIGKDEIQQWQEKTLDPIMQELRMWEAGKLPHYANPVALTTKYGKADMFEPIVRKEFRNCYRRENVFNELTL